MDGLTNESWRGLDFQLRVFDGEALGLRDVPDAHHLHEAVVLRAVRSREPLEPVCLLAVEHPSDVLPLPGLVSEPVDVLRLLHQQAHGVEPLELQPRKDQCVH